MQKKYIKEKMSRKSIISKRLGAIVVAIAIMLGGSFMFFSPNRLGKSEVVASADEGGLGLVSTPTTLSELKAMSVEDIAGLSKFDARDFDIVTPVRDQGESDLCWAYSTIAVSETSILYSEIDSTATKNNLKLSARNIGYSRFIRTADPLSNVSAVEESPSDGWAKTSGYSNNAIDVLSEWCGAVLETEKDDADGFTNAKYKLVEAVKITESNLSGDKSDTSNTESVANNEARILAIKQAIAKYGAVTFSYNNATERDYYNPNNETGTSSYPHACAIIGWDDSIESTSFQPGGATQNGGWIVKNSYTSKEYFYLSYDVRSDNCYALRYETADSLDYNYFYDRVTSETTVLTGTHNASKVANIFEAKGERLGFAEELKSVSVNTHSANSKAKISIYTGVTAGAPESGTKAHEEEFTFLNAGQNYAVLSSAVKLTKGELYSVVVELTDATGGSDAKYVEVYSGVGQSYKYTGSNWSNMNNIAVARVKAYTKMTELPKISVQDLTITILNEGNIVYTGGAQTPIVKVSYGTGSSQVDLVENTDYTLEYSNNILAGAEAKVKITGLGIYEGTIDKTFTIKKAESPKFESSNIIQNSSGQFEITPSESARKLSDISLPANWRWSNGDQSLSYLGQTFEADYMGADVSNYNNISIRVFVKGIESLRPKAEEEEETVKGPDSPTTKKEHKKSSTDPQNVIIILIVIFLAINIGIVVWINIVKNRRHIAMFEKKDAERKGVEDDLNGEISQNTAPNGITQNANPPQQFGAPQNIAPSGTMQNASTTQQFGAVQNIAPSGIPQNSNIPQQFGMPQNATPNGTPQNSNIPQQFGMPQGVQTQQVVSQPQSVVQPQIATQPQQVVNQPQVGAVQQPMQVQGGVVQPQQSAQQPVQYPSAIQPQGVIQQQPQTVAQPEQFIQSQATQQWQAPVQQPVVQEQQLAQQPMQVVQPQSEAVQQPTQMQGGIEQPQQSAQQPVQYPSAIQPQGVIQQQQANEVQPQQYSQPQADMIQLQQNIQYPNVVPPQQPQTPNNGQNPTGV